MADIELVIKIPDHLYKLLKDFPSDSNETTIENVLMKAVENGAPIPDNATVCDIEQIRADIALKLDNPHEYIVKQDAYNEIVDIINGYIKVGASRDVIT